MALYIFCKIVPILTIEYTDYKLTTRHMLECLTAGRGRNELAQQLAALELSQA